MSSFWGPFLISTFILVLLFEVKSLIELWKRQGKREELRRLAMLLWETVPVFLISLCLLYAIKNSSRSTVAKRTHAPGIISLAAFTRE